jgi:hypothetical protein
MLHFADGERALQHILFGNANKFSVMIQLFYDGVGTTNPLHGQSKISHYGVSFIPSKTCHHHSILAMPLFIYWLCAIPMI